MKERLRWLRHIVQMKDDRLWKIVLFGQPFRAKQKAGHPRLGWEDVTKKDLKKMGISWEDAEREALMDWDGGGAFVAVFASGGLVGP